MAFETRPACKIKLEYIRFPIDTLLYISCALVNNEALKRDLVDSLCYDLSQMVPQTSLHS